MFIRTVKLKKLLFYLIGTFLFGILGTLLGGETSKVYTTLNKPSLSPPGIVFPIVWSILYLLMGIASYFISNQRKYEVSNLLKIYWIQLILNALWPFVFWRMESFGFAAVIIALMLVLVIWLVVGSYNVNKLSAFMFIPYVIWLLFALYLNIGIAVLN